MKKRNQLVSALLTGMLIGGTATATVSQTPQSISASDSAFEEAEELSEEESYDDESAGDASDEDDGGSEDSGSDNGGSEDSGSESGGSGDGGAGEEDQGDGEDDGDGDSDDDLTEEERRRAEEAQKAEEERQAAEAARQAEEDEQRDIEDAAREDEVDEAFEAEERASAEEDRSTEDAARQREIDDASREAEERAQSEREEEAKKDAEEAKRVADEEKEAEERSSGSAYYGPSYIGTPRSYYTGTYFVSESQKRLTLNLGFKQIAKVFAMPKSGSVDICEGRSGDARVVGVLEEGSLCYILEDGEEWVFVESGDVRGFVKAELLSTGGEVDKLVEKTGEDKMKLAVQKVDPLENTAYRYTLTTTRDVSQMMSNLLNSSVNRDAVVQFAKQFVGNPYVWGGSSLTNGVDCSGFTQQVYAHFGISIPRVSYEQAEAGVKIKVSEAQPGDLIFYARDGVIYHVVLYIGDGKAINAGSTTTGIVVSKVDYDKVCWACRYFEDDGSSEPTTQASQLVVTGRSAYDGDKAAQEAIIEALANASEKEWEQVGFCRSVIIAQAIEESGWLAFRNSGAGIQATDNNVLGMNVSLLNDQWVSPWSGASVSRLVPQDVNGTRVYNFEDMRVYQDIESCMMDYAAFMIGRHPELRGVNDVDAVIGVALRGYATNQSYQANIKSIIEKYDLTKYDLPFVAGSDDYVVNGEDDSGTALVPDSTPEEIPSVPDSTPEDIPVVPDSTPEDIPEVPDSSSSDAGETPDDAEDQSETPDDAENQSGAEDDDVSLVDEDIRDTVFVDDSDETEGYDTFHEGDTYFAEGDDFGGGTDDAENDVVETANESAAQTGMYRTDATNYTQDQMELIWAIVAEEDDISYDGALAVISSVMNRADQNFGGFGMNALAQLTADGQYCYSPSVADPIYYQRRLGGNVPDYVKQAIDDCLKKGIRSHNYNSFSTTGGSGVQIGSNWYYDADGPEEEDDFFFDEDDEFVDGEGYDDDEIVIAPDDDDSGILDDIE